MNHGLPEVPTCLERDGLKNGIIGHMERLLMVGTGDVAARAMGWLRRRFKVYALVRRPDAAHAWRALGATPVLGDLDNKASLARMAGLAEVVLWCAPPPNEGRDDPRLARMLALWGQAGRAPRCLVYVGTTGVYGDHAGARVSETSPQRAQTGRARRRMAAELRLRMFAIRQGCAVQILRAPGIYAAERLSLDRLRRGDPVLIPAEDVMTNHIHADDLARAACLALYRGSALGVFNVCDDSRMAMGDYYDAMADIFDLPHPPRLSRAECSARLSPMTLSFMAESRCLDNSRIKRVLRWQPLYPDVREGLRAACAELKRGY
jgi:nucleoside-diphosphate-sugar epimerase